MPVAKEIKVQFCQHFSSWVESIRIWGRASLRMNLEECFVCQEFYAFLISFPNLPGFLDE